MFCDVSGGQGAKTHGHKHCLVMDEVDGMAGNEDRGGIQVMLNRYALIICIPLLNESRGVYRDPHVRPSH